MGYNKDDLEKKAIKAIEKHKLITIQEVVHFLPCSSATFYNHELEKLESIKEAINKNKVNIKGGLREKWYEAGNATTEIALYKLCATPEELERLNKQNIDHTTKGDKIQSINPITWVDDESKD